MCGTRPANRSHGRVPDPIRSRAPTASRVGDARPNQLLVAAPDLNVSPTAELKSHNASEGGLTLGAKNLYELIGISTVEAQSRSVRPEGRRLHSGCSEDTSGSGGGTRRQVQPIGRRPRRLATRCEDRLSASVL
jgi:hypothetical protein